jgi:hypothetical protein
MIKQRAFIQPDGISSMKEDLYTGKENFYILALFVYKNSHNFGLNCQKKSLIFVLLLLCGDVETQPGPSSLSREQFQQFVSSKGLKIGHQNIRALVSNFHMLQEFVVSHPKIDIITLSQTHLTKANGDTSCELDGYTFVHLDRDRGKGGGVTMFVKNNITFEKKSRHGH